MQQNSLVENLKKKLDSKISDIKKFEIKTEALDQLNRTYDEENKNLSRQLEILLNQNKELLQRALHDKDQYHLEMNNVQDQLCELRRHKEKLEDKILDQYRTMDVKKSPERKQPLMKRAAKALIHKKKSTSNSESTTEDSSNYSADEQVDHLLTGLVDDTDILFVTSSSSDDHEKITQNNEVNSKQWFRNDSIGGSLRVTNANRFNDRKLTNSSFRPPRTPIRNAFETSSLRLRQPPPPYKVIADSENKISQQKPNLKNFKVNANIERQIAREGEERAGIRDKEERLDKTMSYYENVSSVLEPLQNDDSTMWFEYGCV
uniref:Uncharacterized protein n=1 Tax=Caenorhabditis japonica TaxID=281687 RepID=A0A8R1EN91_CAEJA